MIVLDTTALLYAKGVDHSLRDPARRLIAAVTEGDVEATTTAEVIQEFVHMRARRRGRADAVALGDDYADLLSPLLTITAEQLHQGLEIFARCERMGATQATEHRWLPLDKSALMRAEGCFREHPPGLVRSSYDNAHLARRAAGLPARLEHPPIG